jgi:hypothetical protein
MAELTKPELFLLCGSTITLEQLTELFRSLTGREPTPESLV